MSSTEDAARRSSETEPKRSRAEPPGPESATPIRSTSASPKKAHDPRVHRPKPKVEVATTTQLGLSPTRMVTRGAFGRCPVCGSGNLFRNWVTMVDRCPECSFLFERLEGHWIGAIAINTIAVIGTMMLLIVGTMIITYPELIPIQLVPVLIVVGIVGPFLFYPFSKTLWTAVDLLMRPLKWGEVDPRYVVVDPPRDSSDDSVWVNRSNVDPS